jgi:hypothetical protein
LGQVCRAAVDRYEPGEQRLRGGELLYCVDVGAVGQRHGGGLGPHAGQLVPQSELAQQPVVRMVGQSVEVAVKPPFEVAECTVAGGQ